jgi:hypothetical protein
MNGLGVEFSLCLGFPGSFSSFVKFLLLQSFYSSPVMGAGGGGAMSEEQE